eukprot:TRINITY_DN4257_c1_g1_i2.p1 TRINITY_DN4257_c1_g1~~TRINITY_DN4257_c1_g1_i2.p1  ORF type:complete len:314 (+),score=62.76 TRINITY_DN4257_c1_g1_i2:19-960(+)
MSQSARWVQWLHFQVRRMLTTASAHLKDDSDVATQSTTLSNPVVDIDPESGAASSSLPLPASVVSRDHHHDSLSVAIGQILVILWLKIKRTSVSARSRLSHAHRSIVTISLEPTAPGKSAVPRALAQIYVAIVAVLVWILSSLLAGLGSIQKAASEYKCQCKEVHSAVQAEHDAKFDLILAKLESLDLKLATMSLEVNRTYQNSVDSGLTLSKVSSACEELGQERKSSSEAISSISDSIEELRSSLSNVERSQESLEKQFLKTESRINNLYITEKGSYKKITGMVTDLNSMSGRLDKLAMDLNHAESELTNNL